jgi:hypothetical protein
MHSWFYVWITIFLFSTVAFALIAIVVVIRGVSDLKIMLQGLRPAQVTKDTSGEP